MVTQGSIHPTTHVKTTTTTTFEHEFIINLTTTTLFIINFIQKLIMFISTHFNIQIQQQQHNYHSIHAYNHIIIIKHEFLQQNPN
jgi:hypothetical protein